MAALAIRQPEAQDTQDQAKTECGEEMAEL